MQVAGFGTEMDQLQPDHFPAFIGSRVAHRGALATGWSGGILEWRVRRNKVTPGHTMCCGMSAGSSGFLNINVFLETREARTLHPLLLGMMSIRAVNPFKTLLLALALLGPVVCRKYGRRR